MSHSHTTRRHHFSHFLVCCGHNTGQIPHDPLQPPSNVLSRGIWEAQNSFSQTSPNPELCMGPRLWLGLSILSRLGWYLWVISRLHPRMWWFCCSSLGSNDVSGRQVAAGRLPLEQSTVWLHIFLSGLFMPRWHLNVVPWASWKFCNTL